MRRAGRIHWIMALGLLGVLVIAGMFFFTREGPEAVAGRFMTALAKGDVDTLTELSYYPEGDQADLRRQWEFSTQVAGKYFRFAYVIKYSKMADDKTASVALGYVKNSTDPMAYDENYQLPMVKVGDRWMVDVASISRTMFPALPR